MHADRFNEIFTEAMSKSADVLVKKADEYADDLDCLHNFKLAAHLQSITAKQALGGMMAKHTVSIYDLIDAKEPLPIEKWDEKIIDHINYLILLRAIVAEELEGNND